MYTPYMSWQDASAGFQAACPSSPVWLAVTHLPAVTFYHCPWLDGACAWHKALYQAGEHLVAFGVAGHCVRSRYDPAAWHRFTTRKYTSRCTTLTELMLLCLS